MKILLTNDDGFSASGIKALYDTLSEVADVIVVAPESEQSAVSLSVTIKDPLRAWPLDESIGMNGFKVNGTPSDCVKLALGELLDERPDFVFSGINQGTNTGLNSNYSGTVAGAIEGAMNGLPSVAMSLTSFMSKDFSGAQKVARSVLDRIQNEKMERWEILNVNVPDLPADEIKGIRVASASQTLFREQVLKRLDTREHPYYWLGGESFELEAVENGDHSFVEQGYATVVPLKVNWTSVESIEKLRQAGWDQTWSNGRG